MKNRNRNIRKLISAALVIALSISVVNIGRLEAASHLPKPKISLKKRAKKSATIKLKSGNVTGYRIYMKTGQKGKWQLQALVMRGMKGTIKGKLANFSLGSNTLKLSKLKPKKVYYIKIRAWKSSWRSRRIKLSPYSKVLKIKKYNPKAPTPTPTPTDANTATGDAVQFPEESPAAEETGAPSTEPAGSPDAEPTGAPDVKPTRLPDAEPTRTPGGDKPDHIGYM